MPAAEPGIRPPTLVRVDNAAAPADAGRQRPAARGQNFFVEWLECGGTAAHHAIDTTCEAMLLLPSHAAAIEHGGRRTSAPARSVCILPPGSSRLYMAAGARCAVLTSLAPGARTDAANEAAYATLDSRIVPGDRACAALAGDTVRVLPMDEVSAPADNPRLKFLQTHTLSINWVEYQGPRNRAALSPHAHSNFEQGSLALAGNFVHHLRAPWGPDANAWQDDRHEAMGSPSLLVVPVELIHTSEGVGPGHHLLIDIFCPPRADFIAKGWMANASDYIARVP